MFWIATAAAISANVQADTSVAPERQAQAVVHIVKAARVELGEGSAGGDQDGIVRETEVEDGDGQSQPAVIVEFS